MTRHPVRRALVAATVVAMAYGVGSLIVGVLEGTTSRWWVLLVTRGVGAVIVGGFTFFWSYFAYFRPAASLPPGEIVRPSSPGLGPADTVASVAGIALGAAGVALGVVSADLAILILGLVFLVLGVVTLLVTRHRRRRNPDPVERAPRVDGSSDDDG